MPERSALTQGVQVGVESTPGTNVAANKKLISIGIDPGVEVDMQVFKPMGQKYASIVTPGKEWVEFDVDGAGSYSELLYPLASVLVAPGAPATLDTSARRWDFFPSASAEDTVKTLTIEQGGSVRAHKFNYGLFTELELTFNRDGIEVGGSGMGQRISDGITLTSSPTQLPEVPILPTEVDVYLDATSGGLGTTKLTRALEATWNVGDRFNPLWVLNSANASYVAHVEAEPSATLELMLEADSVGMGIITNMRAGATRFIRVKATSGTLAGSATEFYSLTLDLAGKVSEVGDFSDEDGVYAITYTFEFVYDVTWGFAYKAVLVNKETTL